MIDYIAPVLGAVITRTRDDAILSAVCGSRIGSSERGKSWAPPMVVIDEQTLITDVGAGRSANARLWMQQALEVFRCYGNTDEQAEQLARRVIALWHECGILEGSGGVRIRNAWLAVKTGATIEPKLRRPVVAVRVNVLAAGAPID
jgi:hypothetical protein